MILYYKRDGTPMTDTLEWGRLLEAKEYRRVAETILPDGKWVSTVWLGLNHSYGEGPPRIFETMVFKSKEALDEVDCERYATEDGAIAGHKRAVEKWSVAEAPTPT